MLPSTHSKNCSEMLLSCLNQTLSNSLILEVDSSNKGIGAVLSQRSPLDQKIHPRFPFSPVFCHQQKWNYDVRNGELLAVVLALEEWWHRQDWSEQPFVVWTDHRNLSYLKSAKRLNSCQALWALYLGRLNFTQTYRPGSCNTKPDTLSRQSTPKKPDTYPKTTLPTLCLLGAAIWDKQAHVRPTTLIHTQVTEPQTACLFLSLPDHRCSSGGTNPSWPVNLPFIAPCPSFNVFGGPQCPKIHWLLFLPVPSASAVRIHTSHLPVLHRPWSHIIMDLVTGLPLYEGSTTILWIIFLKLFTLSLRPNYLQPQRQSDCWFNTSSD